MSLRLNETREGVAELVLNAPEKRNALDEEMCASLCEALQNASANAEIKVIVIKAEGKSFSSGGDLKAMKDRSGMFAGNPAQLAASYQKTIQQIPLTIESINKPLLAVIDGPAIGAGFDLACMCDLRLASTRARFAESFASLGLISGIGGAFYLTRLIGWSKALELALTGRTVTAEEAERMGLVHRICEPESLPALTESTLQSLLAQSSAALFQTKKLFKQLMGENAVTGLEAHLKAAAQTQGLLQNDVDHIHRVEALLEKIGTRG